MATREVTPEDEADLDEADGEVYTRPSPRKAPKPKSKAQRVSTKKNPPKPRKKPAKKKGRPPPKAILDTLATLPIQLEVAAIRMAGYEIPDVSESTLAQVRADFAAWAEEMNWDWQPSAGEQLLMTYAVAMGEPLLMMAMTPRKKPEAKKEPPPKPKVPRMAAPEEEAQVEEPMDEAETEARRSAREAEELAKKGDRGKHSDPPEPPERELPAEDP